MSNIEDAISALTRSRWPIAAAAQNVSSVPGLYAIYGDEQTVRRDLGIDTGPDNPLYVGKAEESLVRRELQGHFAVDPAKRAQTGSSTVRRTFAALLREQLGLRAVPRNTANPGHFASYGLEPDGDARLTAWMHSHLFIAVWPAPHPLNERLVDVESALIRHWTPPLNLMGNPRPAPGLKAARALMAAEARAWRPTA